MGEALRGKSARESACDAIDRKLDTLIGLLRFAVWEKTRPPTEAELIVADRARVREHIQGLLIRQLEETVMNRPDLHELARTAERLHSELNDLGTKIEEAYNASLGEYDEETEDTIEGTASGDEPTSFEDAKKKVADARFALGQAQNIIAAVQGYRDFADSGAVPA